MDAIRIAPRRYVRRRRGRRAATLAGVMGALLLSLGIVTWVHGAVGVSSPEPAGTSTPREEWRVGEVPFLYQTDPQWASHPYAGGTVEKSGCGPTCLSMAYAALTGRVDLDPAAMADFSERRGYTVDGMTEWALMTEGAAELGLVSRELPADADAVREALTAGRPVICSVRPGDFTTTGHFIVLAGLTEGGEVTVRDPNSPERSSHPWDLERVLAQCANLWALSVA